MTSLGAPASIHVRTRAMHSDPWNWRVPRGQQRRMTWRQHRRMSVRQLDHVQKRAGFPAVRMHPKLNLDAARAAAGENYCQGH